MPSSKQQIKFIIIGIIAAVAAAGIFYAWDYVQRIQGERLAENQRMEQQEKAIDDAIQKIDTIEPGQALTSSRLREGQSGLKVTPQEPGTAVIVETVVLERPGFVVIYEEEGKPAANKFLNASSLLARGAYSIVSIAIPEKLELDKTYNITIHFDTNNSGTFEEGEDLQLTKEDGSALRAALNVKDPKK